MSATGRTGMRRIAWAILPLAIGMGFSAHAALRAIADHRDPDPASESVASGYESEDHFPGAALLYAGPADAAPARGTTGTAALPPEPVAATGVVDWAPAGNTIVAAQPFSMAHASAIDRGRALQCLTAALYYEAASESDDGQRAVAQVILNRVRHPAFPATVCGVVYQGSEKPSGCQFSFACDGAMARRPMSAAWSRSLRIAAAALAGQVFAPVGLATHYHTFAVTPAWNRELVMTDAIGAHFFHRWKGYWGTAAAFHQVYLGGEAVPGPHPSLAAPPMLATTPMVLASAAPVAVATTSAPSMPVAAAPTQTPVATIVQPAYADSGTLRPGTPAGESQVLDRWKDSGKPLR